MAENGGVAVAQLHPDKLNDLVIIASVVLAVMSKCLEHPALDDGDIDLFQDLAEISVRSGAASSSSASFTKPLTNTPTYFRGKSATDGSKSKGRLTKVLSSMSAISSRIDALTSQIQQATEARDKMQGDIEIIDQQIADIDDKLRKSAVAILSDGSGPSRDDLKTGLAVWGANGASVAFAPRAKLAMVSGDTLT